MKLRGLQARITATTVDRLFIDLSMVAYIFRYHRQSNVTMPYYFEKIIETAVLILIADGIEEIVKKSVLLRYVILLLSCIRVKRMLKL